MGCMKGCTVIYPLYVKENIDSVWMIHLMEPRFYNKELEK